MSVNGYFNLNAEADALPEVQVELDAQENAETIAQEREPPMPDTSPLDVFGDSRIIGSPPFPPNLLPAVIERRAVDVAERLGVDPALVALPMLAVCASVIDDRVQIIPLQHDTSWKESARLWVAVIADSGQKKTPAINAALAPVRLVERDWMVKDQERLVAYHTEKSILVDAEKQQNKIRAKALATGKEVKLHELPHPPLKPPTRRKEVKDTTVEALSEVFVENPWGLLAVYDELTGWFSSFDAYRADRTKKDRSLYLEAYNGGSQVIDRVSRGRVFVPNWSLSLVGGIQPAAMRKLAGQLTDDGLAQRFITVFVESDGMTIDRPEDEEARIAYELVISRLMHWDIGGPHARILCRFSPEAADLREFVNQRIHYVRAMPWVTQGFQTHLSKWEGLFPRLCLIWHCIKYSEILPIPDLVDLDTAQSVAAFMLDYLLPHAARFYSELLQTKEEEHYARWIAGHILAHDLEMISVRDIGRVYRQLRGDTKETQRSMEHLVAMAWVIPADNGLAGGHKRWKINPQVHTKFAEQKKKEKKDRAETIRLIQEAVGHFPALDKRAE